MMHRQMDMMKKLTILDRERGSCQNYPLKSQFNNDTSQQDVPNTLALTNMINQEYFPWCV